MSFLGILSFTLRKEAALDVLDEKCSPKAGVTGSKTGMSIYLIMYLRLRKTILALADAS